jgi:diketogulonate reductase-like aldo/keto reductase
VRTSSLPEDEIRNFWGTQISKQDEDEEGRAPSVPSMDPFHGTLPNGAYTYEAEKHLYDPKPTCRISLLLDQQSYQYPQDLVRICQRYLDSGFQTFQGASPDFIQKFHAQTPSKIVGATHWALKLQVPETAMSFNMIRQQVLGLLDPITASSDAIDTLLLQCTYIYSVQYSVQLFVVLCSDVYVNRVLSMLTHTRSNTQSHTLTYILTLFLFCLIDNPKSPYHLDVLDVITEMQREGWIRSIGIENFPPDLATQAIHDCGFSVQLVQQNGNLLCPPEQKYPQVEHQWMTNSLVDGLLSGHYAEWRDPPSRHGQWKSTIRNWGKRQGVINDDDDVGSTTTTAARVDRKLWKAYQEQVLQVLQEMTSRYGVSVKCIALRWALESEGTSSVVIPIPAWINEYSDFEWKRHIKEMRQAFSFHFEDADKEVLADLAKKKNSNDVPMMDLFELEELLVRQGLPEKEIEMILEQQKQQPTMEYSKIDLTNTRLWL